MSLNRSLLGCVIILLVLSAACNSVASPGKQTVTTQPVTIQSATTQPATTQSATIQPATPPPSGSPTATPLDLPTTLTGLYQANLKAKLWTEGQGLALLLGLFTGDTQPGQVPGSENLHDVELTGLLRFAREFLKANPTGDVPDQVQKLVNKLMITTKLIEKFSQPGKLAEAQPTTRLVSLNRDSPQCDSLWINGFDTATTDLVCFEFAETVEAGTRIRLYYPSYLSSDSPMLHHLQVVFAAAKLSVDTYNSYGPVPIHPITLVVTEMPGTNRAGQLDNGIFAMADNLSGSPTPCYVGLFPSLLTESDNNLSQVVAHELFHCYEYANLTLQESGPDSDANQWWVEGAAEYFGNVVYPSNNLEYIFFYNLSASLPNRALFEWEYEAWIFFQYLESRPELGVNGVLRLLRSLPTSGGSSAQMVALAAFPNIETIFHEFGQALVDGRIRDTSGSFVPYQAHPAVRTYLGAPDEDASYLAKPFRVGYNEVHFAGEKDYEIQVTTTGTPGTFSSRLPDEPGSWGPPPDQIYVPCGQSIDLLLVTQTRSITGSEYQVKLHTPWVTSTEACDQCLLGSWILDDASYLTNLNALLHQSGAGDNYHYTQAMGRDQVEFTGDLRIAQHIFGWHIISTIDVPGAGTHSLDIYLDGNTSSSYSIVSPGQLAINDNKSNVTPRVLYDGGPLGTPPNLGPVESGPLGTGGTYVCTADTLSLIIQYPGFDPLPALRFTKVH